MAYEAVFLAVEFVPVFGFFGGFDEPLLFFWCGVWDAF